MIDYNATYSWRALRPTEKVALCEAAGIPHAADAPSLQHLAEADRLALRQYVIDHGAALAAEAWGLACL